MNDKKSCENCRNAYCPQEDLNGVCKNWQRNPSLWLSILPTEPGWYFARSIHKSDNVWLKTQIFDYEDIIKQESNFWRDVSWQGPITPTEAT